MEPIWAVVLVAGFGLLTSLVAMVVLARTAWLAMNRRMELERLAASLTLSQREATLPLAASALEDGGQRRMVKTPLAGYGRPVGIPNDGEDYGNIDGMQYVGGVPVMPEPEE